MKNALQYYYDLKPKAVHRINNDYICQCENGEYLLQVNEISIDEIEIVKELNELLLNRGFPCHQIITNNSKSIITNIEGKNYVLLKIFVKNREIEVSDLLAFSSQIVEKRKYSIVDRSNWYDLWINKLDYIEYQISQFGKNFAMVNESINYYIGMAENAISLVSGFKASNMHLNVSHRRIKHKNKLRDMYNPLQFVLDVRVRDLSEYIKASFFADTINFEKFKNLIFSYKLNTKEALLLFARLVFPSYYFDCYQEIVLGEADEIEIKKYTTKSQEYQTFLKLLYQEMKKYYDIPEIEWINKI